MRLYKKGVIPYAPKVIRDPSGDTGSLYLRLAVNASLTFCTGSYGVRADNDLPGMVKRLVDRIHFLHLRSVQRENDGSFYEADHLQGSSQVTKVMYSLLSTFQSSDRTIPVRPDHGHKMMDDLDKDSNPGYSCIGRLDGLAKLKGLEKGIQYSLDAAN